MGGNDTGAAAQRLFQYAIKKNESSHLLLMLKGSFIETIWKAKPLEVNQAPF